MTVDQKLNCIEIVIIILSSIIAAGMIFCHKSGFLAAFDSKESAIKFAEEYLR